MTPPAARSSTAGGVALGRRRATPGDRHGFGRRRVVIARPVASAAPSDDMRKRDPGTPHSRQRRTAGRDPAEVVIDWGMSAPGLGPRELDHIGGMSSARRAWAPRRLSASSLTVQWNLREPGASTTLTGFTTSAGDLLRQQALGPVLRARPRSVARRRTSGGAQPRHRREPVANRLSRFRGVVALLCKEAGCLRSAV